MNDADFEAIERMYQDGATGLARPQVAWINGSWYGWDPEELVPDRIICTKAQLDAARKLGWLKPEQEEIEDGINS